MIYLTFWNAIIHACYHIIALANDFIGTNEINPETTPIITRIRDYIFAAFALPLGMNVTFLFWALYSIDRELVFPRVMDPIYPSWLNHILHTNVGFFIAIELFISYHHYPSRKTELKGLGAFVIIYISWVFIVRYYSNAWVYPILNVLEFHERIGFFGLVGVAILCFYFVGEYVNKKVWSGRIEKSQKRA